jgi:hypothetical protein
VVGIFEEWDGAPLRMDSPSLVVLAQKQSGN